MPVYKIKKDETIKIDNRTIIQHIQIVNNRIVFYEYLFENNYRET